MVDTRQTLCTDCGVTPVPYPRPCNPCIDRAMERALPLLSAEGRDYCKQLRARHPKAWDELASLCYSYDFSAMVWALRAMMEIKPELG